MTHSSPSQQPKQYTLHLEADGRLTLPTFVLRQLALQQGDKILLTVEEDSTLRLVSTREQLGKLRGILKDLAPERSLVNELIQERREEAGRE